MTSRISKNSPKTAAANGPTQQSQKPFNKSIQHLNTFPLVADAVSAVTAHPIGQRSIYLTNSAYESLIKPLHPRLTPLFEKANTIASPYVSKADDIADQGLGKVEEKFPILKEPTENVRSKVTETIGASTEFARGLYVETVEFANGKKEYILSTFNDEYAKEGAKGYVPLAKAGINTSRQVSAETIQWLIEQISKLAPHTTQQEEVYNEKH